MFDEPLISVSRRARGQVFSEFVATVGLVGVVWCSPRKAAPFAVGAYIAAAYWFTASTSFANPAVTAARSLTDTFSGIRPQDVPAFILAQLGGALAASMGSRWFEVSDDEDRLRVRS
jgi:glycerol uptake facilitator-like aquaporin